MDSVSQKSSGFSRYRLGVQWQKITFLFDRWASQTACWNCQVQVPEIFISFRLVLWYEKFLNLKPVANVNLEYYRLGEIHTLRGHVESVVRLKNLDLNVIQAAHTVWSNMLSMFYYSIFQWRRFWQQLLTDWCWL